MTRPWNSVFKGLTFVVSLSAPVTCENWQNVKPLLRSTMIWHSMGSFSHRLGLKVDNTVKRIAQIANLKKSWRMKNLLYKSNLTSSSCLLHRWVVRSNWGKNSQRSVLLTRLKSCEQLSDDYTLTSSRDFREAFHNNWGRTKCDFSSTASQTIYKALSAINCQNKDVPATSSCVKFSSGLRTTSKLFIGKSLARATVTWQKYFSNVLLFTCPLDVSKYQFVGSHETFYDGLRIS